MVQQATREKQVQEPSVLASITPHVAVELQNAEMAAFNLTSDAFKYIFAEKVRNSEIGRILSRPESFEGSSVRYARIADEDIYSVEINFNNMKRILTLRVGEHSTEMMLTGAKGNEIEYLRQYGREIEVRRA